MIVSNVPQVLLHNPEVHKFIEWTVKITQSKLIINDDKIAPISTQPLMLPTYLPLLEKFLYGPLTLRLRKKPVSCAGRAEVLIVNRKRGSRPSQLIQ